MQICAPWQKYMRNSSDKVLLLRVLGRFWDSPTFTTWGSFITRSLSLVVVLPLLLTRFSTEEIVLWYLFATIMSLQLIADMGFSITFARVIAYGMGGAKNIKGYMDLHRKPDSGEPNWETITRICSVMNRVYLRIALGWFVLLASIGTCLVIKPIAQNQEQLMTGWLAWAIVMVSSTLRIYGNRYISYFIGINRIALFRRWEALMWLLTMAASLLVLLLGGGLLGLVIATQSFIVFNMIINFLLFRTLFGKHFGHFKGQKFDRKVFSEVWPNAWRSGLASTVGAGLVQGTGIFYAQIGSAKNVAAYLLALSLIRALSQFSQAPFYTKIPVLSRLRAEGQLQKQQRVAQRGMLWSFYILAIGIIIIDMFGATLLEYIKSNANFVGYGLWSLMGFAAFLERYGAMHIQFYSTTNHIIAHIANGVTGLIFILGVALSYVFLGVYAFPISQIVANAVFYNWYAARHSYAAFRLQFWDFERKTVIVPFVMLLAYFCIILIVT